MTIEPPSNPPRAPGEGPGPPRGEMPSTAAMLAVFAVVVVAIIFFAQMT